MDLRKICDSVDEQGWVKVAIKVANDKADEAKTVLDQLGYTAYDIEWSGNDKVIKVSTQHPDETKAKLLPKFKEAGITPISTRVTDSNKRLDEYILGSLRANGIESAVNVEQHKDGFRVSLQSAPDAYIDLYLDGENVVARESPSGSKPDYEAYARFAGIPEQQAAQVTRKFKRWAHNVQKLDARPVAELESVRVTDAAPVTEQEVRFAAQGIFGKNVAIVHVTPLSKGTFFEVYSKDDPAAGTLLICSYNGKRNMQLALGDGGSKETKDKLKKLADGLRSRRKVNDPGIPPVKYMSEAEGARWNISDFPNFSVTGSVRGMRKQFYGNDALLVQCGGYIYNVSSKPEIYEAASIRKVRDDGFSLSSVIKEAMEATGTTDIFDTQCTEHGAVLESKESDAAVIIRKSSTGKNKYAVAYSGDTTPPKVAALLKSLRERLSVDSIKDSISNADIIDPVREVLGDAEIIEHLVRYMSDHDLEEFVDDLKRTYDLDYVDDSVSVGDVVYAVIRDMGAMGLITAEMKNGVVHISLAGSKEPMARVKKGEDGSYGVYLIAKREELTAKQEEFIDALAEALAANPITDSVEDLKLPKFSSNAKLNKLCTYLAEAAIEKYDTLDAAIEELENYKDRFSDDLGYGYIQNGNIHSLVSDDDALAYLHDAGYATKMSGDAAWDAVCRTMGQVIRTLLKHKDELLKQKVTDEGWGHAQRGAGFITPEIAAAAARRLPVEGARTEIVGASKNFPAEVHVYEDGAPEFSAPQVVISLDEDTHKIQVSLAGGDGTSSKVMDTIYKLLYDDLQGKIGLPEVWRAAKGKVYDAISSRASFLDGNDYIEIEDIAGRYYPNAKVIAGFGRGAGEISAILRFHDKDTKENIGDFELTFDGRAIRKHGEDKLREMGDFDAMVEDLVANNPFKQYEAEIREKMNDTSRIYDSAKLKDDAGANAYAASEALEWAHRNMALLRNLTTASHKKAMTDLANRLWDLGVDADIAPDKLGVTISGKKFAQSDIESLTITGSAPISMRDSDAAIEQGVYDAVKKYFA